MGTAFRYFVVLADMRTGSNALEERLNDFAAVTCHGEVFNPHFIGHAGKSELFGVTIKKRNENPTAMIEEMIARTPGIAGFRLFSDHDPRVLAHVLSDRTCAKIVLTRNPIESYVSLKIARQTGQWWLGDLKTAKTSKIRFDAEEFERYIDAHRSHQAVIRHALQVSGQTAFPIGYGDLSDDTVIEGVAAFLGIAAEKGKEVRKGKIQNPRPLSEKVSNYTEMLAALAARDPFETSAVPSFEPRRGPNVPSYIAARGAPLLYLPIRGTESGRISAWLAAIGGAKGGLAEGFTQKTLRQWLRTNPSHRSFTVVAHPVERAHRTFVERFLVRSPDAYPMIRETLRKSYKVPIPDDPAATSYSPEAHRRAFLAFLKFVEGNIGGQTSVRVDGAWASQAGLIEGMSGVIAIDRIVREIDADAELAELATQVGAKAPAPGPRSEPFRFALADIYGSDIEKAARAAFQRDYVMFGFEDWKAIRA